MLPRIFHIALCMVFLTFSRSVPAQTLPSLPVDGRIQKGTLRCGVAYYVVKNDEARGFADFALVRRGEAPTEAVREELKTDWLSRHGIGPRPGGYFRDADGSTVLHLDNVPVHDANVLDSTLLMVFAQAALSRADEAVIVSGDIDQAELRKKMDIFSMLVPQHFAAGSHAPDYVWEPSVMPSVVFSRIPSGDRGMVRVAYASPRTPYDQMNTAQSLVMGILSREFQIIAARRIERNLREAGIPYGKLEMKYLDSSETSGDEEYAVEVLTDREHMDVVMKTVSQALAGLDGFGIPVEEYTDAKKVMMADMVRREVTPLTNRNYVDRCTAHFLYGSNLAPYGEETRLFARKNVADTTETRLFNQFATSVLSQLSNLTLEYRADLDSLDEDEALFQYNLAYLYGSTFREARNYSWQRDSSSLEVSCPRVKIKETKAEPVSGGTLWTLSNGVRVTYRQVPGSGSFHYALLLNGGLSEVSGLSEGEGGYFGDILSLSDAGGLSASDFRDHLAVNGIGMETDVNLTFTSIHGSAPSSKLPTLLKALLAISNNRTMNRSEFDVFLRNAAWERPSVDDGLYRQLYQGFDYAPRKYPSALGPATLSKAAQFFESRFSRVNEGMLVLVGDLDEQTVRRALIKYAGGFRTRRGTSARKSVRYQPHAGTSPQTLQDGAKGAYIRLDTEYPLTGINYLMADIAAEVLRSRLVRELDGTGLSVEVTCGFHSYPQERLWMFVACEGEHAAEALPAIRKGIREAGETPVQAKDLTALKSRALANIVRELSEPETVVTAVVNRYGIGKDLFSHYKESVNGITAERLSGMLSSLASGLAAETVVE